MDDNSDAEKPMSISLKLNEVIKNEGNRGFLPGLVFSIDLARWISHQPLPTGSGLPYLTEGVSGFIDQHLGNAFPTVMLYYFARIPVEIGAKVVEAFTSQKLSARAKLYVAMAMGVTWPILIESGIFSKGNTIDSLDHFGTIVAAAAITAGFEIGEFFSKPPPSKMVHAFERISGSVIEKTKPVLDKLNKYW